MEDKWLLLAKLAESPGLAKDAFSISKEAKEFFDIVKTTSDWVIIILDLNTSDSEVHNEKSFYYFVVNVTDA